MKQARLLAQKGLRMAKKMVALCVAVSFLFLLSSCWLFKSGTPMEQYDTPEAAMQDLGFSCSVPGYWPDGYELKSVEIVTGNMLSLRYENGEEASLIFRCTSGEKNRDFAYSTFSLENLEKDADITKTVLEANGTAIVALGPSEREYSLAVWYAGNVTYVLQAGVYKGEGLPPEVLTEMVKSMNLPTAPPQKAAVLYTNMETGSEDAQWQEQPFPYPGQVTVQALAEGLTDLTGLDFNVDAEIVEDGIIIDWDILSSLFTGPNESGQKDEFHFYDEQTLQWFMMDSLWRTLRENLDVENIYYTMDGGKELVFDTLYPENEFPSDRPYYGSAVYYGQDGGNG